jgi:hypothetical protein
MVKSLVAILAGSLLGLAGSRYLFVGSWLSLIPWGIVGLVLGYWSGNGRAMVNGAVFGFFLAFMFMVFGYTGTAPLVNHLPFFALLGLIGAACGLVLGWFGAQARQVFERQKGRGK